MPALHIKNQGTSQIENRLSYFDNLKGILTLLVVIGHFLIPLESIQPIAMGINRYIYIFHMPLFVFVSGLFAKSIYTPNKGLKSVRILNILVLSFLFQALILVFDSHWSFKLEGFLTFSSASWYLLSLASWYLLTPFFSSFKPIVCILTSIALSIIVRWDGQADYFLAIGRTINFMPFFLLGYFMDHQMVASMFSKIPKIPALLLLSLVALMSIIFPNMFESFHYLVYGGGTLSNGLKNGLLDLINYYLSAIFISILTLSVTPSTNCPLTKVGKNSLQIYILHRLIRPLLSNFGMYELLSSQSAEISIAAILLICILLTVLLSSNMFTSPFDFLMKFKWGLGKRSS